jgi:trk system potassium uptake protein
MVVCSLNFLLFIVILRKNWKRLRKEEDALWFVGICIGTILLIAGGRTMAGHADFLQALRQAAFTVVSIGSTSGFGTADYQTWPAWSQALLAVLMLMGGCAGSTAGGFKVGRLLVFLKSARQEIIRTFRSNQVLRVMVNGKQVDDARRARTMFFLTLYFVIAAISVVVVGFFEAGTGASLETCAGAVIAALSNIGPGFGTVGPTSNFAHLREPTHLFLAWLMILGRLELFALLVLFFPSAWRKY